MNFTKILFLSVLLLNFNNFGMLRSSQILKTLRQTGLSKPNFEKQHFLLNNNKLNKRFYGESKNPAPDYKFEFNKLASDSLKKMDPKKALDFLNHFKDIKSDPKKISTLQELLNSKVAVLNLNPEEALEILYYLKESEFSEEKNEQLKKIFENCLLNEQTNFKKFSELSGNIQRIILDKRGEGFKKISSEEIDDLIKRVKIDSKNEVKEVLIGSFCLLGGAFVFVIVMFGGIVILAPVVILITWIGDKTISWSYDIFYGKK